jgi:hypothetical protein
MEGNMEIFLNVRKGTVLKFFHRNKIEHYFLDLTVKCCDWIRCPFLVMITLGHKLGLQEMNLWI